MDDRMLMELLALGIDAKMSVSLGVFSEPRETPVVCVSFRDQSCVEKR